MSNAGQCLQLVATYRVLTSWFPVMLGYWSALWYQVPAQCETEGYQRKNVSVLHSQKHIMKEVLLFTCIVTMTQAMLPGLTQSPQILYQLIFLTLSPCSHLLSPSLCQPILAPLSSLKSCRLCLKSFNPISLWKNFFAQCLTSQTRNSCPESVLFFSL